MDNNRAELAYPANRPAKTGDLSWKGQSNNRSTKRDKSPINMMEKRTVHLSSIKGLSYYFILVLGILLALSIELEAVACKGETPDEQIRMKIAEELFKVTDVTEVTGIPWEDIKREKSVKYNHNGYGCTWDGDPYKGGHSGWDLVFYSDSPKFHSLTSGIVLADGKDANGKLLDCETNDRIIAIYDKDKKMATLYLHAKDIELSVKRGEYIRYGDPLGLQGDCGKFSTGAHVHIEVRKLKSPEDPITDLAVASWGTDDEIRPVISPIPYLYNSVESNSTIGARVLTWVWALLREKR